MSDTAVREEILEVLDGLTPLQQQEILRLARSLSRPRGKPARSLLKFAGRIPADDVDKMEQAIEDFETKNAQTTLEEPRVLGLHAHLGTAWMSDDFGEPLSDEFWLGKE
jgi:hypothetical protein